MSADRDTKGIAQCLADFHVLPRLSSIVMFLLARCARRRPQAGQGLSERRVMSRTMALAADDRYLRLFVRT